MAIYKASNTIGKLYKGSNQIGKVYKGSTLIYTAEELIYTNGTQNYTLTVTEIDRNNSYVTFNSDSFYIQAQGSYGNGGSHISALTSTKIDVTSYDTLHIICQGSASGFDTSNAFYAALSTSLGSNPLSHSSGYNFDLRSSSKAELTFDISSITGSYYIGVCANAYQLYDYSSNGTVYQIWLD